MSMLVDAAIASRLQVAEIVSFEGIADYRGEIMKPSAEIIMKALLRGERLTPLISLSRYGIHALSQRVGEIKKLTELEIISQRVKGDYYHEYFIPVGSRK